MKFLLLKIKSNKAQTAIEFLILVISVLMLFVIFLYSIQVKISDTQRQIVSVKVNEIAKIVQDEINLARISTDGYYRTFNLPQKINGLDYTIEIVENSVYIQTEDGKNSLALPVGEITGILYRGENIIYKINNVVGLN